MRTLTMLVATATLLVTACGGGGSSNAVTADVAEDHCRAGCAHEAECDPQSTETVEECTASCVDDVVGVIREDVFIDVTACVTALDCGASDDSCRLECTPTGSHDAYETACRANLGQCDLSTDQLDEICEVSTSPSNDLGYFCLLAPAIIDELTACFGDGTCQEQTACLQAALEANGVDI